MKLPPGRARDLVRQVLREGWTLDRRGKHMKLRSPAGDRVVISTTASDVNAERNIVRDIERIRGRT